MWKNLISRLTSWSRETARPVVGLSALEVLAARLNEPVGPADLEVPPAVRHSPGAFQGFEQVGRNDGEAPGTDEHGGPWRPTQPSAGAVRVLARTILNRLGERWEQQKGLFETGRLGAVLPAMPGRFGYLLARTWPLWVVLAVVLCAGLTAELVYGVRAAALLSLGAPLTALLGAVAFSLAMNGLAWYAGHLLFESNQNIVRTAGAKLAIIVAVLIGILVTVLGLVVGGFDPIQMNTVEGGGAAVADTAAPAGRWTLAVAYALILTVVSASVAAGHLLILDKTADLEVRRIKDAERHADRASLSRLEQVGLMIALGEATASAVPAAHEVGRGYVEAYNSSFRHHVDQQVGELFNNVEYDAQDPEWLAGLHYYLDRLRAELDEPDAKAHRRATVTRIA